LAADWFANVKCCIGAWIRQYLWQREWQ